MTSSGTEHPALTPVRLGELTLANAFAVAPMTRVSATAAGVPTAQMADYYARFAHGGFGLVISEGTYTDTAYSQGYLNQPGIVTASHVDGWTAVADAVHRAGAPFVLQLMHAGALSQGNPYRDHTAGPSAVTPRGEMMPEYQGAGPWAVPKAMAPDEIDEAVNGFVASAVHARRAGCDGVEVHAANGYLLDQFLTRYTNERTDSYGGPVTARVRLVAEVIAAIRAAVGDAYPVGVRLSQGKVNDFEYRWTQRDAEIIFAAVADAGASYLHIASEGRDWIESARLDGGSTTITGLARRLTGLPVIANGGMHVPEQGADGHADVLSVGRGALADPGYSRRVMSGEPLVPFDHGMLQPLATLDNTTAWRERQSDLVS